MSNKEKLIDIVKSQVESGGNCLCIESVGLDYNGFSQEEIIEACEYFCSQKYPSYMNLTQNELGDLELEIFSRYFKPQLKNLILKFNHITDEGIKYLINSECTNLTSLDLSLNRIENTDNLAELLLKLPKLNFLDLHDNNIHIDGLKKIAKALKNHNCLELLIMYGNPINEDDATDEIIFSFFKKNKSLTVIKLGSHLRTDYQFPKTRAITDRNYYYKKIGIPLCERLISVYDNIETL